MIVTAKKLAEMSGINLATLYRRLKKEGIDLADYYTVTLVETLKKKSRRGRPGKSLSSRSTATEADTTR